MKCPNCGAMLNNGVCEYCGFESNVKACIDDTKGTLTICGKVYNVMLLGIDIESVDVTLLGDCTRKIITKRRFILHEI